MLRYLFHYCIYLLFNYYCGLVFHILYQFIITKNPIYMYVSSCISCTLTDTVLSVFQFHLNIGARLQHLHVRILLVSSLSGGRMATMTVGMEVMKVRLQGKTRLEKMLGYTICPFYYV